MPVLDVSSRPVLAACGRKFFDIHITIGSHIAKQAVKRIGQLYAVEKILAHQRLIGNDPAPAQVKIDLPRHWPRAERSYGEKLVTA